MWTDLPEELCKGKLCTFSSCQFGGYYDLYFSDGKIGAQNNKVPCPKIHSWWEADWGAPESECELRAPAHGVCRLPEDRSEALRDFATYTQGH